MPESPSNDSLQTPPIDVSAALLFHKGRLLVTQRPPGKHLAGLWEFPGGKRDKDESWEHCLKRELQEELGIEAEIGILFSEVRHAYPGKTVHLRFFCCRLADNSPPPRPIECSALKWVLRDDLPAISFPPADAALIRQLLADTLIWELDPRDGT